jgi:SAM-dependent methyltransferase
MRILNLGCGLKTSSHPNIINIDWSIYLFVKNIKILRPMIPLFFQGERLKKFAALPNNILVHNLKDGIPFESNSVDAVYHSHMLEHLDQDVAQQFLFEVKRVLKVGGIHRVVVPDLEELCKAYLLHCRSCEIEPAESVNHDSYIASLLEQSVRKEASSTSQQNQFRRTIENFVLGDARKRGETHQWMYDKINIKEKLITAGYREVYIQDYQTSLIPAWAEYGLDVDESGKQYKPDSIYVEACK